MNTLVESLKRLYSSGKVTEEKLTQMVEQSKITDEEKKYIMSSGGEDTQDLQAFYDAVIVEVGIS